MFGISRSVGVGMHAALNPAAKARVSAVTALCATFHKQHEGNKTIAACAVLFLKQMGSSLACLVTSVHKRGIHIAHQLQVLDAKLRNSQALVTSLLQKLVLGIEFMFVRTRVRRCSDG